MALIIEGSITAGPTIEEIEQAQRALNRGRDARPFDFDITADTGEQFSFSVTPSKDSKTVRLSHAAGSFRAYFSIDNVRTSNGTFIHIDLTCVKKGKPTVNRFNGSLLPQRVRVA